MTEVLSPRDDYRNQNVELINDLISNLDLDVPEPCWNDLSSMFQKIENVLKQRGCVSPDVKLLSNLLLKTKTFSDQIPDVTTNLLEKLQAIWWISKVIYVFVDRKDLILPADTIDTLTTWYLDILQDLKPLVAIDCPDQTISSKLAEIISALASIVYSCGPEISLANLSRMLSPSEDGILIFYLYLFPEDKNDLTAIPKRAIQVVYALCVKSERGKDFSHVPWLRKVCLARIRDSFQKYYSIYKTKPTEVDMQQLKYLLSISKGLYVCLGNSQADEEPVDKFEVEKIGLIILIFIF